MQTHFQSLSRNVVSCVRAFSLFSQALQLPWMPDTFRYPWSWIQHFWAYWKSRLKLDWKTKLACRIYLTFKRKEKKKDIRNKRLFLHWWYLHIIKRQSNIWLILSVHGLFSSKVKYSKNSSNILDRGNSRYFRPFCFVWTKKVLKLTDNLKTFVFKKVRDIQK